MPDIIHNGLVKKPALPVEEDQSPSFWSSEVLSNFSKSTLSEIATSLGISFTSKTSKASLISLISED